MIGVIDYEAGNLASVSNALRAIDANFIVSSSASRLRECNGVILPGVGAAPLAMRSLQRQGLAGFIQMLERPFLGICLGMQLLYDRSEEGDTKCLGIISGTVRRFDASISRVPHMGWNDVHLANIGKSADWLPDREHFYFAHSYYAEPCGDTAAVSDCGISFSAAIRRKNFFGVQFHPEKSGATGLDLLKRFCDICE